MYYKVNTIKIRHDLLIKNRLTIAQYCMTVKGMKAEEIYQLIFSVSRFDQPAPLVEDPRLRELLGIEAQQVFVFDGKSPLENRREAQAHVNTLLVAGFNSGKYLSPLPLIEALTSRPADKVYEQEWPIYNGLVSLVHEETEYVILRILGADREITLNHIREYELYKTSGYDIGAAEPFYIAHPDSGKKVPILPDNSPHYFKSYEGTHN